MKDNIEVPFFSHRDLPREVFNSFESAISSTLKSENLINGHSCEKFESEFAHYIGSEFSVGVGNGLDAISLSLRALGIGSGNRVAVPAHTFIATWLAVLHVGATPIGVEVTPDGQMNLAYLEGLTDIDCVIPVHMHGFSVDMPRLVLWAKANNVWIIEDCAQAHGLSIQGKKVGSWGDLGAFSFYPTKNLFALGDGGAVVTNNKSLADLVRKFARYGSQPEDKYAHDLIGYNSRLDTIQAAVLLIGLKYLDEWNANRNRIAEYYRSNLKGNLAILGSAVTPSVYHHFVVLSENRDLLREKLKSNGIQTEIHYPNLAAIEISANNKGKYTVGEKLSSQSLSLPMSPWQSDTKTQKVVDTLNRLV